MAQNNRNPLLDDSVVLNRMAKYIVHQCFRNTVLADSHAGTTPDSAIGHYPDVVARSPFGEIPWLALSRLNDEEMKALMKDAANKRYRLAIESGNGRRKVRRQPETAGWRRKCPAAARSGEQNWKRFGTKECMIAIGTSASRRMLTVKET